MSASTSSALSAQVLYWAIGTLVAFTILNGIFFLLRRYSPKDTPDPSAMFSIFWAIVTFILMFLFIPFLFGDAVTRIYAMLSIVCGALAGWLLGMYISPQGSTERQEFAKIGTAVAGLASGYGLKTAQSWLGEPGHVVYRPYLLLALIAAVITAATIYYIRTYGSSVNISFAAQSADPKDRQKVVVKQNDSVQLRAAVTGVINSEGLADTSVRWSLLECTATGAEVSASGLFKATTTGSYRVVASSVGNSRLSDVVDITVE